MSYSGMGMIFTTSGKRLGNQPRSFTQVQAQPQVQAQAQVQAQVQAQPQVQAQAQVRAFPQVMAGAAFFRTMDLGSLKNGKSCGSCGH